MSGGCPVGQFAVFSIQLTFGLSRFTRLAELAVFSIS